MEKYALAPKYMERFQCIGAACEDTCCNGWGIAVDKNSYSKYKNVNDSFWKERFNKNVVKLDRDYADHKYASLLMNPHTGNCNFLEEGLCSIQATLGESFLCNTCATYPRYTNEVDGIKELSLSLSCPEAARQILFEPEGIEFININSSEQANVPTSTKLETQSSPFTSYFWDMRIAAIEILQNREFSIQHRLLLLGWFSDHITDVVKSGNISSISSDIAACKSAIETSPELRNRATFPSNEDFKLTFLNTLILERATLPISNKRYRECLDDYISGLIGESGEAVGENYKIAFEEYYIPYVQKNEHILENYLVNTIYNSLYPAKSNMSIFNQFVLIAINFSLIQMHLIGVAACHKGLNDELVLKVIQSYSKNYEHSQIFLQNVFNKLKEQNYLTLGHLSLLMNSAQ